MNFTQPAAQANLVEDVEHLMVEFNKSLRKWKDYKAHVNTQVDSLKQALRAAHANPSDATTNRMGLAGAVKDFGVLISSICASPDERVRYAITTEVLKEEAVLDDSQNLIPSQILGNMEADQMRPEMCPLKVKEERDVKIAELEQVITQHQLKAIACIDVSLQALQDSVCYPPQGDQRDSEKAMHVEDSVQNAATSGRRLKEGALAEVVDQVRVIFERTRLLSTTLLYGSWNAACEILETCGDAAGLDKGLVQSNLELVKEELEHVLSATGDLHKLFNIDADALDVTVKTPNAGQHTLSPVPQAGTPVAKLIVNILEDANLDSRTIWQSDTFEVDADRFRKPDMTLSTIIRFCKNKVQGLLLATNAQYFDLFHVEVPSVRDQTSRVSITGRAPWKQWYATISKQPQRKEISITCWFHAVPKEEGGGPINHGQLFRKKQWMQGKK